MKTVTRKKATADIWIGLAHVRPQKDCHLLGCALGAFVPILALADDSRDFVSKVISFLEDLNFEVVEIEDIQLFEERRKRTVVAKNIEALAANLTDSNPVSADTFQTYEQP